MFLRRWEIAASLLNGGADTLSYAGGSQRTGTTRWRDLLVCACAEKEENYMQVCETSSSQSTSQNLSLNAQGESGSYSEGESRGLCDLALDDGLPQQ